ncbi:MAG: FAD binding domain-containing protein [Isosphaeraceae bacterium]|nr:FAD binding domain-containing protein [Isosphaeraceae bacterium]
MKAFDYAAPASVEDAVKLLEPRHTAALGGGTDLINRMKDYVSSPEHIVYLKDVKSLAGIESGRNALTIGANTTLAALLASDEVKTSYPAVWQSAYEVGTPQIRNMATVGGNLLQRPRCWYYRSGNGLLAIKDGKSLVRAGDNRYHAIFLTDGDALFVSPSSLAPALIALGAKATVQGLKGERTIPVADLYRVPKSAQERELSLQHGELLTKVTIPVTKAKNASVEARQKQSHDWPLALASAVLDLDGDRVRSARIVLGAVAPVPLRSEAAEKAITGKPVTLETAAAAAEAAVQDAKPLSMNAYKVALTKTVVKRALLAAVGNRYWEEG